MALSFPRLPRGMNLFKRGLPEPSASVPGMCHLDGQPVPTPLPGWAELEDDYMARAFTLVRHLPPVVVVEYRLKPGATSDLEAFSRIYVTDASGKPPPFMQGLWKELHDRTSSSTKETDGYHVSLDGRITRHGMPVGVAEADVIAANLCNMYAMWAKYPSAKDYATAKKLHEAQIAIDSFKFEENFKTRQAHIKSSQERIKELQEQIASDESELNKIYEKAADAMNLFEENGIEPDMSGDGSLRKKADQPRASNMDFASMYPSSISLNPANLNANTIAQGPHFCGSARILRKPEGGLSVVTYGGDDEMFSSGDMVFDPTTRMFAIWDGYGWEEV